MNKLRIAYVVPRFYPFKGGAENNILAMAERMANEGHEVSVHTAKVKFSDENLSSFEEYKGIKIHRHFSLNKQMNLGFYPGLFFTLLKNDYDLIHSSGFGFIWIETCLFWKNIFSIKTKFINTPHGPFLASANSGIKKIIKKIWTFKLKIYLPWIYDGVLAVVDNQREWIKNDFGFRNEKIFFVPNGINPEYIDTPELPDSSSEILITYLGRFEEYKGVQDIIKAMNILINEKNIKNIKFVGLGRKGNDVETLEKMINEYQLSDCIQLIYSPTDQVRDDYLRKSQIHILPSRWEATGIGLIESMAKGNIIISSQNNDALEMLIKEGISGYSHDYGNFKQIAEIIEKLVNDFDLRIKIIKHNYEFVKEFTWDKSFENYKQMIQELWK